MPGLKVKDLALTVPGRTLWSDVSLDVPAGESLAVMGPSGSGKTSLLHCLCGIKRPSAGEIEVGGTMITGPGTSRATEVRRVMIGMVFQFGELLPELSVAENVQLPLRLAGCDRREASTRATNALKAVGLQERKDARPDVLSGGEVQRVAIARATAKSPVLVLADEPTGALDEVNGLAVANLMFSLAKEIGAVVVIATHNPGVARLADRVASFKGGRLVISDVQQPGGLI